MVIDALTALVIVCVMVIGNVIGWIYSYGKLSQKVKGLNDSYHEVASNLKDLDDRVDGISRHVATLEGTITTFMDFIRRNNGTRRKSNPETED